MSEEKQYWFKRRRYGYGWFPVTGEGWLVVLGFVAALIGGAYYIKDEPDDTFTPKVAVFLAGVIVLILLLIVISYRKGPRPRWRWGAKPTDNPDEDF